MIVDLWMQYQSFYNWKHIELACSNIWEICDTICFHLYHVIEGVLIPNEAEIKQDVSETSVHNLFIDHKAGEIICLVASVRLSVCQCSQGQRLSSICPFSTGAEWSIVVLGVVLGFAKYSKKSNETQISYTLKNIIESSSPGAFKMVVYVICCLDRLGICGRSPFYLKFYCGHKILSSRGSTSPLQIQ